MRRVLHLGHVNISTDFKAVLEDFENCLKRYLTDCCTTSSFGKGRVALVDGANSLNMLLTDCCTSSRFDDEREVLMRYPLWRLLGSIYKNNRMVN
jgi:hypothetical protein